MMTKELQEKSVEFVREYLNKAGRTGHDDVPTIMVHMAEEFGELASQVYNEMAKRGKINIENVGEEIADIWFDLCLLADKYGLDMEQIVTQKIEKDMKRLG